MSLNVNRKVVDIYYRYKMPKLLVKVEGKGNRTNTVLQNLEPVGKSVVRPSKYIAQYFGYKLGTSVRFKEKRWILNGSHTVESLQNLLDGFIQDFVLCNTCENPETQLDSRGRELFQWCKACGQRENIKHQKLVQFILKNISQDPAQNGKSSFRGKKCTEDIPKHQSTTFRENACRIDNESEQVDDDWCLDISEDAVQIRRKELCKGVRKLVLSNVSQ